MALQEKYRSTAKLTSSKSTETKSQTLGNLTRCRVLSFFMNSPLFLTPNDDRRLNEAAIQRFHEVYPVPEGAIVLLAFDRRLLIAVQQPSQVADLIVNAEWLKSRAYLVFGAVEASIWLAGVEVWKSNLTLDKAICEQNLMSNAILDRAVPAIESLPFAAPPEAPQFMSIDDLAILPSRSLLD